MYVDRYHRSKLIVEPYVPFGRHKGNDSFWQKGTKFTSSPGMLVQVSALPYLTKVPGRIYQASHLVLDSFRCCYQRLVYQGRPFSLITLNAIFIRFLWGAWGPLSNVSTTLNFKQTTYFLVTLLRLKLDNIYRRLNFVLVNVELHFYLVWFQV